MLTCIPADSCGCHNFSTLFCDLYLTFLPSERSPLIITITLLLLSCNCKQSDMPDNGTCSLIFLLCLLMGAGLAHVIPNRLRLKSPRVWLMELNKDRVCFCYGLKTEQSKTIEFSRFLLLSCFLF